MNALVGDHAVDRVCLVLGSDAYRYVVRAKMTFFLSRFEGCRVQGSCVNQSVLPGGGSDVFENEIPLWLFSCHLDTINIRYKRGRRTAVVSNNCFGGGVVSFQKYYS